MKMVNSFLVVKLSDKGYFDGYFLSLIGGIIKR